MVVGGDRGVYCMGHAEKFSSLLGLGNVKRMPGVELRALRLQLLVIVCRPD